MYANVSFMYALKKSEMLWFLIFYKGIQIDDWPIPGVYKWIITLK